MDQSVLLFRNSEAVRKAVRPLRMTPFRTASHSMPGRWIMPDRNTIRQTLIELLEADTGEKYPDLDDNANLREGLGLDSVDVVSIVSQIERRFRIRLTQQELEKLVTVDDVLNLLESKFTGGAETSAA